MCQASNVLLLAFEALHNSLSSLLLSRRTKLNEAPQNNIRLKRTLSTTARSSSFWPVYICPAKKARFEPSLASETFVSVSANSTATDAIHLNIGMKTWHPFGSNSCFQKIAQNALFPKIIWKIDFLRNASHWAVHPAVRSGNWRRPELSSMALNFSASSIQNSPRSNVRPFGLNPSARLRAPSLQNHP